MENKQNTETVSTSVLFDKLKSRRKAVLSNGMIFGIAGTGKSFVVKKEIIRHITEGHEDVILLDTTDEYSPLCESLSGTKIEISDNCQYSINPLDMMMCWDDEGNDPLYEKCNFMVGMVEIMRGNDNCSSLEIKSIHKATKKIFESYISEMERRHNLDANCPNLDSAICPTLIDFYDALNDLKTPESQKIAESIEPFCTSNGEYNMFAKKTNLHAQSRLVVYNLSNVIRTPILNDLALYVCITSIWNALNDNIRKNRLNNTTNILWIYLEDFTLFLRNEVNARSILYLYKRCRQFGGVFTGIAHDVIDVIANQYGQGMLNNTGFLLLFNQSALSRMRIKQLYDISDELLDRITHSSIGHGILLCGNEWSLV